MRSPLRYERASFSASEAKEPAWKAPLTAKIEAFKNRKRYAELSPDVLKTIPDSEVEQAIVDFVDCRIRLEGNAERQALRSLSKGFLAVYTTWGVEAEVNNGGFNQYFWNSAGEFATDAAEGFDLIGAPALARLTERAIAIHTKDEERMARFKTRGSLEAFSESYEHNPLNELDEEFYRLARGLSQIRVRFVRRNPALFQGRCEAG